MANQWNTWDTAVNRTAAILRARRALLRIVTWNVWFDPSHFKARQEGLIAEAISTHPDALCFQEVTPRFHRVLRESRLGEVYDFSPGTIEDYGVLMLVRRDWNPKFREIDVPTDQGRSILVASFGDVELATVHLESLDSADIRRAQLERLNLAAPGLRILCGDFNFDDREHWGWWRGRREEPLENRVLAEVLPDYVDVWPFLRPGKRGYTFDGARNANVRNRRERMRYDRVMAASADGAWRPQAIGLLGLDPIDRVGTRPSDHYGLVADFFPSLCRENK